MTDIQRDRLLRAALGFLALEPRAPELRLLHRWADSWRGVGRVALSHAYITLFTTTGSHSLSLEPGGSAFSASRRRFAQTAGSFPPAAKRSVPASPTNTENTQ